MTGIMLCTGFTAVESRNERMVDLEIPSPFPWQRKEHGWTCRKQMPKHAGDNSCAAHDDKAQARTCHKPLLPARIWAVGGPGSLSFPFSLHITVKQLTILLYKLGV